MPSFVPFSRLTLSPGIKNGVAFAAGISSFVLFWLSLSPSAFPGESAALTVSRLNIEPWFGPGFPLWRLATAPLARLSPDMAVYTLNLWSALCAGIAVGLLTRYMIGWIRSKIRPDGIEERYADGTAILSGLLAALFFATSAPVWVSATRLHTQGFHAILIVLAFNLLQDYVASGGKWRTYALALLCGVGIVETVLMLVVAPFLIASLLISMYRRHDTPWGRLAGLTVTGVIGTVLCAYLFRHTSASGDALQTAIAKGQSLSLYLLKEQYHLLQNMFPRVGWVWPVFFIAVPWVAIQFEAKTGLNDRRNIAAALFHVVLAVLALLIHANVSFLPWANALPGGRLPVLELLLTSMTAGYAFACLFARLCDSSLEAEREHKRGSRRVPDVQAEERRLRVALLCILCVALVAATLLSALSNGRLASGRRGAFARTYVEALLGQLGDRTWLVTDGLLDPLLQISALCRGQTLHLLDLSSERQPDHIRRLRQAITDDASLKTNASDYLNAANLGGAAFIQDWLATDPHAANRVAFYAPPDLLFEAGLTPLPDRLLFTACQDTAPLRNRDLCQEQEPFWAEAEQMLAGETEGDPVLWLRGALRRHVSLVANNLGVLLEDLERPTEAYKAYRRALSLCPDNFSAMLNRVVLTRKGVEAAEKPEAETDARIALDKLSSIPDPGRLARFYGYVRVPGEFSRQSAQWSSFGQPKMATAALRRAMELSPKEQKAPFLKGLAEIELSDGNLTESAALYQRVLDQTPLDIPALLGMVRVAVSRSDVKAARTYLNDAKLAGIPDATYQLEDATIDFAANDWETAQRKLQELTDQDPKLLRAWALQANILITQAKAAEVEQIILPRMLTATGNAPHYLIALTQGYVFQAKGRKSYEEARSAFLRAYKLSPGNRQVLTALLNLDYALRDEASTERHAVALLRIDRDDVLANYLMGTLLINRNDLSGAEAHLRRSLAAKPSSPVCNDLAETLRLQGKLEEAEKAIRQALSLDPKNAFAYDTLACILLAAGRLKEARQACDAALALDPKALPFRLTDVRILALSGGDPAETRERVRRLNQHADRLSPQQRADLHAVSAELKKR